MKIRHWIAMVAIVLLLINFAAGGLIGFESKEPAQAITIEMIKQPGELQGTITPGAEKAPSKSIYSKTTIISLIMAVMAIVAFRRNTYS